MDILLKLGQWCGLNITKFDPDSINLLISIILKLGILRVGT